MEKITLQQLESFLWESANILRGGSDASKFKDYIFAFMFFFKAFIVASAAYLLGKLINNISKFSLNIFL